MIGSERKSVTRLLYPNEAPRSVRKMRRLPAASIFCTTLAMSHGARNCPFLTFTTRPVRAAATIRSVCRRSEEHTSELQSLAYLVCRLLLEKKKKKQLTNK